MWPPLWMRTKHSSIAGRKVIERVGDDKKTKETVVAADDSRGKGCSEYVMFVRRTQG